MRCILIMLWVILVFTKEPFCEPLSLAQSVDQAIVHVLRRGIPEHQIGPHLGHTLLSHPDQRRRLAAAIVVAAKKHQVSPWILIAVAFREGSFRGNKEGSLGERSVFQIMPATMRMIQKIEPDCSFATVEGSALCAAALLRREYNNCKGSMIGALVKYVTGKGCVAKTGHVKWIVRDRQGIAKILEGLYGQ